MSKQSILQIAKVCHEANRAYCETISDYSQPNWESAPDWQKESAVKGVEFHLTQLEEGKDPAPSDSHNSWLEQKKQDGWSYGETKDPVKKTHPCFVPYEDLPIEQQQKDYIFAAIVRSFFNSKNY